MGIASIEELIEEARNGRPYILVDADDRENEGDVIVPGEFATAGIINFMASHARGLICLAITKERAGQLNLSLMAGERGSRFGTAFTTSIEARTGVTTGISASDRARTVAVAVDPHMGASDLVSPGHIFPLIARDGGVLVRPGHTEAAVDISRLAGLQPSGVICEVMRDDGTMARLPDLEIFADVHNIKIGTISDLIAFRRRSERLIEKIYEAPYNCDFGDDFRILVYRGLFDGSEHVALVRGMIQAEEETLVRVHRTDMMNDLIGMEAGRSDTVQQALQMIARHVGPAVAVFVQDPHPISISDRLRSRCDGPEHGAAIRDYAMGAQILRDLGVRVARLLTSNPARLETLAQHGLHLTGRVPFPAKMTPSRYSGRVALAKAS